MNYPHLKPIVPMEDFSHLNPSFSRALSAKLKAALATQSPEQKARRALQCAAAGRRNKGKPRGDNGMAGRKANPKLWGAVDAAPSRQRTPRPQP